MQSVLQPDPGLEHAPALNRLATRLARGHADDLVQSTWVRALEHDGPVRARKSWLRQVLRNEQRMEFRRRQRAETREAAVGHFEEPHDVERLAQQREVARIVDALVEALPDDLRDTVRQRYFEGHSAAEIARRDEIPAGTVRWRLKRGMDQLREQLDDRYGGKRALWAGAFLPPLVAPPPTIGTGTASPTSNAAAPAAGTTKGTSVMSMKVLIASGIIASLAGGAVVAQQISSGDETTPAIARAEVAASTTAPSKTPGVASTDAAPGRQLWAHRIEAVRAAHTARRADAPADTAAPSQEDCDDEHVGMCTDEACAMRLAEQVLGLVDGCEDFLADDAQAMSLKAHVIGAPDVGTLVETVDVESESEVSPDLEECLTQAMYTLELENEADDFEQDITVMLQSDHKSLVSMGELLGDHGILENPEFLRDNPEVARALAQLDEQGDGEHAGGLYILKAEDLEDD